MATTLEAVFDGKVFHPEGNADLIPNRHYILIIHEKSEDQQGFLNTWDVLDELTGTVEASEDWALEQDHYLYGVPRKREKDLP